MEFTHINSISNSNSNKKKEKEKKKEISLDDEWLKFISIKHNEESDEESDENDDEDANDDDYHDDDENKNEKNTYNDEITLFENKVTNNVNQKHKIIIPLSSEIIISTKSKIAYLNQPIDLKCVFWGIQVMSYATPLNGLIKKQMKFNSLIQEDLDIIKQNLKNEHHIEEQIITSINNPTGRIKFKDIRKVSIGLSKKDLVSYRCKKKSAFYNCLVMILRIKINSIFKEFHVKVFNTGKMEIPGVQNDIIFEEVLLTVLTIIKPFVITNLPLLYQQKSDTVLINSNFNCGFYINREILFDLLKFKYDIQCIYDPCSYPGIQCKFYYNRDLIVQTGSQISTENKELHKNITQVSFMVFRTGSILIVGMCDDSILYYIYEFLKNLLIEEFHKINQSVITPENTPLKTKKIKLKHKTFNILQGVATPSVPTVPQSLTFAF